MSGSTDAATVAERTKLQAELRELQSGLDDTYYNHAMDSKSQALDDEIEAYTKSAEDYITTLRESIKDTKLIVEQTMTEVLGNADIVLSEIDRLAEEYKFTIDPNLKEPWINASKAATDFKTNVASLDGLVNEAGIITTFGSETNKQKLSGVFGAGSSAASQFALDVDEHMGTVQTAVNSYTTGGENDLGSKIKAPWDDAGNDTNSGPLAFSTKTKNVMNGVVDHAKQNYQTQLKENLEYPWKNESASASWGNGITTMLNKKVTEAKEASEKIAKYLDIEISSHEGVNSNNGNNDGDVENKDNNGNKGSESVKALQKFLNEHWNTYVYNATRDTQLVVDGIYGNNTMSTVKAIQKKLGVTANGKWNKATIIAMKDFYTSEAQRMSNYPSAAAAYKAKKNLIPAAIYAKGSLNTSSSGFAITDESWIGEEITLAAGKNGQLQYLKKGSAVMPADISANLVEWGKLNPNMMSIGDMTGGIQMMSNYVSKPELNLSFDSLVHVDHCDEGTLKDLEKMVDTKIDQFSKQMNYAIKRFK